MGITKYGDKDGRIIREKQKKLASPDEVPKWTEQDRKELVEEQADSLEDGD